MKKNIPSTPFPTTGYFGPKYFCDRERETRSVIENIRGGMSTTLISIRRIGKTGLIKHVQNQIEDGMNCIYLDILPTENMLDFLNSLATSIVNSIPEKSTFGTKVWNFLKSLRPVISFDSLSGDPTISFNIHEDQSKLQIENLFSFLEKQDKKTLFAIDEFQQILKYTETNTEAWLRSIIQQLKNVVFIFSGSQQHLMNEMFSNPSRPFFRSTQFLKLEKIEFEQYHAFIHEKFQENKRKISSKTITEILDWANLHTYYVQLLCNRVYINYKNKNSSEFWREEALRILKEQEYVFFSYRDVLTKQQWNLLRSIALEKNPSELTSKDFIQDHKLGSPSTVRRSLSSLLSKELIYKDLDKDGKTYYSVYDVLFQNWIQNQYHRK